MIVAIGLVAAILPFGGTALAGQPAETAPPATEGSRVEVVTIDGYVDPITKEFLLDRLRAAASSSPAPQAILLRLDSSGALGISDREAAALAEDVASSPVPVAVLVGPGPAKAEGAAAWLYLAAHLKMVGPQASVGPLVPAGPSKKYGRDPGSFPTERMKPFDGRQSELLLRSLDPEQLVSLGLADAIVPTLGDAFVELDGREVVLDLPSGEARAILRTAEVVTPDAGPVLRRPAVPVVFHRLGFLDRVLHSAAAPAVAYMLVMASVVLVALEMFTAGIGIVALSGAVCLALGAYGLSVSEPNWVTVAAIAISGCLFGRDVQAGVRSWASIAGIAATALGLGVATFGAPSGLAVPTIPASILAILYVAAWRLGIVVMARTRFWAPSIARDKLIGATGDVGDPLDPHGTVILEGARFPATTSGAPLFRGAKVVVDAVAGIELVVSPRESR